MRRRAHSLGLSLAALAALGLTYGALVRTALGQRFDEWSGGAVRLILPGVVGDALSALARPGALLVTALAVLVLVPWALASGRWMATVAAVIVALVSTSVALELRSTVLSRPDLGVGGYADNTFPSTHAAAAFSLIVAVLLMWPSPIRSIHLRWAGALAVLVGAGNVTSYAHRPADVLGSLLLVAAVAWLVLAVTGAYPGEQGRRD